MLTDIKFGHVTESSLSYVVNGASLFIASQLVEIAMNKINT